MKPLTKEQLRDNAAAMLAFADGKPIELLTHDRWIESLFTAEDAHLLLDCMGQGNHYRPKPQPVSRPWSKPEDVPLHCWIRQPSVAPAAFIVTWVGADVVAWVESTGTKKVSFSTGELANYEHSTDRVTWKPCTVEDAQ